MSGRRYLAFFPDDAAAYDRWREALIASVCGLPRMQVRLENSACLLFAERPVVTLGETGAIVGDLFHRGTSRPTIDLPPPDINAIQRSRGAHLIDQFWGSYVAILAGLGSVDVLRAPIGDLACYRLGGAGGTFIASDIDLLTRFAGYRPSIDWTAVADALITRELRQPRTCLSGIIEVGGGERLSIGDADATAMWSPWRYVPDRQSALDPGEAAETLRRTICLSVAARVSPHAHSVLLLSGGLDSSIIAAALARWQCAATGLTMVTRDLSGDERSYASATATHLSLPLHEIYRDLGAVDVTRSRAAGLPYPSERSFTQATSAAAEALAAATGASAILHGGGGDNVFASVQSAAPVTDLIRRGHIGPRLWRTTASIATLAHATHAAVIGQAITRLARRGPAYRWQPSCELLSDDGNARADEAVRHPWLDSPPGALPGSATHIANILRAIGIVQSPDARAPLPSIAVLMAQPIVEACLAIPSWYWVDRGHNRAVGRHAFADMLPNAIAWRRSKGAPDSFTVDLYEANRDLLRDFVLEGRLAASGLIDRDAVARELARRGPTRDRQYGRILQFADVEAWLQSWL